MKQAGIQFFKTMTFRKRGEGAYLRKNILKTDEEGFYPSIDFIEKPFGGLESVTIGQYLINDYVFIRNAGNVEVYKKDGNGDLSKVADIPTAGDVACVAETDNYNEVLVIVGGDIFKISSSTVSNLGTVGGGTDSFMVYNGFEHFISVNNEIKKLDPANVLTTVKNTTANAQSDIINMQVFNGYIVMIRTVGTSVQFDFWDIANASLDTYQKRVIEKNCRHLACGVIAGRLIFVKSVGNNLNQKENKGDIVVTAFDGEKFTKLNSIRAGGSGVSMSGSQNQSIGNGIMLVAITQNQNSLTGSLFKNWVLKIGRDGSIETVYEINDVPNGKQVRSVYVGYGSLSLITTKTDGRSYFLEAGSTIDSYSEYEDFTKSEYITNFLNNNKNVHKLHAFGVSYEKVFEQAGATRGERLFIDYRTSERDSWTLLHEINTEKIKAYEADKLNEDIREAEYSNDSVGQTVQSYVITKMPNGDDEMPRFNEIQFRFRSKKGFSVLNAWYNYETIIRNTI